MNTLNNIHYCPTSFPEDFAEHEDDLRFSISPETIAELLELNDVDSLRNQPDFVLGVASALHTSLVSGIPGDERDLYSRHKTFGSNINYEAAGHSSKATKSFEQLFVEAFKDTSMTLLLCCATLSLVIEIKMNGPQQGFLDGALIFLSIFIVINFGTICRYLKARMMTRKLAKQRKVVSVIRCGKKQQLPVSQIVVGDIICLESGDEVPADGFCVDTNSSSCKLDDGLSRYALDNDDEAIMATHFPLFSGAKVVEGKLRMLVTSVGRNSERSKLMRFLSNHSHQHDEKESKLETAIHEINSRLEKTGLGLSLLLLVVQAVRCFAVKSMGDRHRDLDPKGVKNTMEEIMNEAAKIMKKRGPKVGGFLSMLCVLIFALRDGLPLGILISFVYASRKMRFQGANVKQLPACATIGSMTSICLGKMDGLDLEPSKMAILWIGLEKIKDFQSEVDHQVAKAFCEGIYMNDSGAQDDDVHLHYWAKYVLGLNVNEFERSNSQIIKHENFHLKSGFVLIKRNHEPEGVIHVHWKGGPDLILSMCSHYYDVHGAMQTLDHESKRKLLDFVDESCQDNSCFQCYAFAYKEVKSQEDSKPSLTSEEVDPFHDQVVDHGLTLLGFVGLKNPYELEVRKSVENLQKSGVNIRLVLEDDFDTASLIAVNSGILRPEELTKKTALEASEFRNKSEEERLKGIENIRVLAKCCPSDKLLFVQSLKHNKEVAIIGVTGNTIRDFPILKEADVGIFAGDIYAKSAREGADIDVLDTNNIGTIFFLVKTGRLVCRNLQKLIRVQLSSTISSFVINFFSVACKSQEQLPAFQVLSVNIIMNVLGSLALAIFMVDQPDGPEEESISVHGSGSANTKEIVGAVLVQATYLVCAILFLDLKGRNVLNIDESTEKTMIFNVYVLSQVFLLVTAVRIKVGKGSWRLEGILRNKQQWLFIFILGIIVSLEAALIEIMAAFIGKDDWKRLDLKGWFVSIAIAGSSVMVSTFAAAKGARIIKHLASFVNKFK